MANTRQYQMHTGRQSGLSLVELMIAMVIGLLLLIAISSLIVQQSSTRDELEKSSRQIENGRYAMQILRDDIQHAGFYGMYYLSASYATLPDPCLNDLASLQAAMLLPLQGYSVSATATTNATTLLAGTTCDVSPGYYIADANYKPGTSILVVRRADSGSIAGPAFTAAATGPGGMVYLQTNSASAIMNTGANANTTSFPLTYGVANPQPAPLRNYIVRIYFISPCSIPANGGATCTGAADDNGNPIPTLKRLELSASAGNTTWVITPLVEGIENMQFDYGIDSDNDGYPDSYTHTPAASDWQNVMGVQVSLLARNNDCSTGFLDTKSYVLGMAGTVSAPAATCTNGDFKRHVFSELIRVTNPSGRRAQQ